MGTRSAIILTKNDNVQKFYRQYDGYPHITGVELLTIAYKHGFDYDKVRDALLTDNETYQPADVMPLGIEFEYTIDCSNGRISCMDIFNEEYIDDDSFHSYNPNGEWYIQSETQNSDELDFFDFDLSDEDGYMEDFLCQDLSPEEIAEIEAQLFGDKEDESVFEWKPDFPVDMQNPAELTPEQIQRGDKLYDSIIEFLDSHPEDRDIPMLCITQEWDISVDYGGHRCDSDFVTRASCVMCHDDEGWFVNRDYVRQCVPFLETKLREAAEFCMELHGEVSNHRKLHNNRVAKMQFAIQSMAYSILDRGEENDLVIAVDTITQEVYGWPLSEGCETYGGIIQFYSIADLTEKGSDGTPEISIDKIESIVKKLTSPIQ